MPPAYLAVNALPKRRIKQAPPKCKKRRYKKLGKAIHEAERLQRFGDKMIETYQCPSCGFIHIGHGDKPNG